MEARELRVGNKVYLYGTEATIIPNDFEKWFQNNPNWEHKAFRGIELTEDWLVRLGFEFTNGHFIKGKANLRLFTNGECQFIFRFRYMVSIYYVHQLQNLYFDLTGTELTLK